MPKGKMLYLNIYVVNNYLSKILKKHFCKQFWKCMKINKQLEFEKVYKQKFQGKPEKCVHVFSNHQKHNCEYNLIW